MPASATNKAIVAVLVAAYLSARRYFQQEEYKIITKLYLENGIDVIANELDAALRVFMHNLFCASEIIRKQHEKDFPQLITRTSQELCTTRFRDFDPSSFCVQPHYRVMSLIASAYDTALHDIHQRLFHNVYKANMTCYEICDILTNDIEKDKLSELEKRVIKLPQQIEYGYEMLERLNDLSKILQTRRIISYRELRTYHQKKEVKAFLTTLHELRDKANQIQI